MSTLRSAEKPRVLVSVGAVRRSTGSQGNNSFTTCRDQNSLDLLIRREKESLGEERKKKKKTGHQNTRKQGGEVSQKKKAASKPNGPTHRLAEAEDAGQALGHLVAT